MFTLILGAVLTAIIYYLFYKDGNKNDRAPPGPPRWPIIGNLHQVARSHPWGFMAFHKLSLKYGDVMSIKLGVQETVVLSSYQAMRDLLGREELSGRIWTGILVDRSRGKPEGLSFTSGENQKLLKNFAIRTLREFGFGKQAAMENIVSAELEEVKKGFIRQIKEKDGIVLMKRYFQLSLLNVLWGFMAGIRYEHDDPKLQKLMKANSSWFQGGNFAAGIVTAFPFIRFILREFTEYNKQIGANTAIYEFLEELVREYRAKGTYAEDPRCFIDVFLKEIDKHRESTDTPFTDGHFLVTCYDIFQAGFETTSNTTAFGILYMMLNPEVQRKVQLELDTLLPGRNPPTMEDREKLPYTRATLYEIFRMSNILPIPGPRKVMQDVVYKDYVIKKDTAIVANTYSPMQNKAVWGDPENFRPERFLDSNGQLNGLHEHISIVFGYGRRSCLGETLAQTTGWMYFTTLMQNFTFESPPDQQTKATTEPIFGIILSPTPFRTLIKIRE